MSIVDWSLEEGEFGRFVEEATKELQGEEMAKGYRAMAGKFVEGVIPATPVDSGQARGGWLPALSKLRGKGGPRLTSGVVGGTRAGVAAGRKLGKYVEKGMRRRTPKPVIEIFNGVRHIVFLELGSSLQAPSGMIRLTLRKLTKTFTKESERSTEAALRLANMKARAGISLRQGLGRRGVGRAARGRV